MNVIHIQVLTRVSWMGLEFVVRGDNKLLIVSMASRAKGENKSRTKTNYDSALYVLGDLV